MKHITINRIHNDQARTIGTLTSDLPELKLYTLELPWRDNQHDISCIPLGVYDVCWLHTDRFPNGVYRLLDVPNRSDIDIHAANHPSELLGCIAVGLKTDHNNDLIDSDVALASLQNYLGTDVFMLTIIEAS